MVGPSLDEYLSTLGPNLQYLRITAGRFCISVPVLWMLLDQCPVLEAIELDWRSNFAGNTGGCAYVSCLYAGSGSECQKPWLTCLLLFREILQHISPSVRVLRLPGSVVCHEVRSLLSFGRTSLTRACVVLSEFADLGLLLHSLYY